MPRSAAHARLRRQLARQGVVGRLCVRCGLPILAGQAWDLDHRDDRRGYLGPAHARCNRSAGAALGNRARGARKHATVDRDQRLRERIWMDKYAIGIEVSSPDRHHASIGRAGNRDGFVVVELAAYVDVPSVVAAVEALIADAAAGVLTACVIDRRGPARNLGRLLTEAGIDVTFADGGQLAEAHGETLDRLAAGTLRVVPDERLSVAMRHGEQRRSGDTASWSLRGSTVDTSPMKAVELAVWGLVTIEPPPPPAPPWAAWGDPVGRVESTPSPSGWFEAAEEAAEREWDAQQQRGGW